MLDRAPGEVQRGELRQHRVALADDLRCERLLRQRVARLDQEPAEQSLVVELTGQRARPVRAAGAHVRMRSEYPQVALAPEHLDSLTGEVRRDEIFEEYRGD